MRLSYSPTTSAARAVASPAAHATDPSFEKIPLVRHFHWRRGALLHRRVVSQRDTKEEKKNCVNGPGCRSRLRALENCEAEVSPGGSAEVPVGLHFHAILAFGADSRARTCTQADGTTKFSRCSCIGCRRGLSHAHKLMRPLNSHAVLAFGADALSLSLSLQVDVIEKKQQRQQQATACGMDIGLGEPLHLNKGSFC